MTFRDVRAGGLAMCESPADGHFDAADEVFLVRGDRFTMLGQACHEALNRIGGHTPGLPKRSAPRDVVSTLAASSDGAHRAFERSAPTL